MADSFIFQQNRNNQIQNDDVNNTEFYTLLGDEDYLDKDNNPRSKEDTERVLAKKIKRSDGSIRYMIKRDGSGKLYNPVSIYAEHKSSSSNFLDKTCKDFRFRSVSMKIFEYYVSFLKTKNLSWLYNAEREAE